MIGGSARVIWEISSPPWRNTRFTRIRNILWLDVIIHLAYTGATCIQILMLIPYIKSYVRQLAPRRHFNTRFGSFNLEHFVLTVGRAHILETEMEFWEFQTVAYSPTKHAQQHIIIQTKLEYFNTVVRAFGDEFVIPDPNKLHCWSTRKSMPRWWFGWTQWRTRDWIKYN